jgi:hypothetical protein
VKRSTPPGLPTLLKVGGKTYRVELVRTMNRKGIQGRVYYELGRIELGRYSNVDRRRYTNQQVHETFWHEVVHAILYEMDSRLFSNERFVDTFAKHLSSAIRSARFA